MKFTRTVRWVLPLAVWAALVTAGGTFVYGCRSNYNATYSIGGTVSGDTAAGLVLQDNGGDNYTVPTGSSTFSMPSRLGGRAVYAITVLTNPAGLTCTVSNGSGMVNYGDINTVVVSCLPTMSYTIGGTILGDTAAGLVLQDNGGDNLTVAANATSFTFATALAQGATYNVTVFSNPSGLTCSVTTGAGTQTVGSANVTSVVISCAASAVQTYTIGGTISGDTTAGLVLQDNGGDNLTVAANATSFTFATALAQGATYNVTVLTSPSGLNCTVTTGGGPQTVASANVTSVVITCAAIPTYTIGGTISGDTAAGLVLQDNGGDNLTVAANATSFTFATALTQGSTYNVTVLTSPSGLTCTVTAGGGANTVGSANVTSVVITCISNVSTVATLLAAVTNVAGGGGYASSISLYDISHPLTPAAVGSPLAEYNVLGIAIDASNNLYYLANTGASGSTATFYACPAPAGTGVYSCAARGTAIAGGQWLTIDAHGQGYATSVSGTTGSVVQFALSAGPTASPSVVYTTNGTPSGYGGLAVTRDGAQLYISEAGSAFGTPFTIHTCALPCAAPGGTDITSTLNANFSFGSAVSGSMMVGPLPSSILYIGGYNTSGSISAAQSSPVVAACSPGASNAYTCEPGMQTFPLVAGDVNPYQQTLGVAVDSLGNAYVGAWLNPFGPAPSPPIGPTFMGFQPPVSGSPLTAFACSTSQSNGVPTCPINTAIAAPAISSASTPPLYSLAVTLQ